MFLLSCFFTFPLLLPLYPSLSNFPSFSSPLLHHPLFSSLFYFLSFLHSSFLCSSPSPIFFLYLLFPSCLTFIGSSSSFPHQPLFYFLLILSLLVHYSLICSLSSSTSFSVYSLSLLRCFLFRFSFSPVSLLLLPLSVVTPLFHPPLILCVTSLSFVLSFLPLSLLHCFFFCSSSQTSPSLLPPLFLVFLT